MAVAIVDICLVPTADIRPVSAADICPVSPADICPVSAEDICPVPTTHCLCVCQKLAEGPAHAIVTDFDNRTVTRRTDHTPQDRIAVRFEWALPFGELLKKTQKIKTAMGIICQVMDMPQNWGRLSEMGSEWSPGAVTEAPSFQR